MLLAEHEVVKRAQNGFVLNKVQQYFLLRLIRQLIEGSLRLETVVNVAGVVCEAC